jgi:putative PIN family toxin of toxin-antitoxin system
MRLVLDTNVIASALLWDGEPRRLLRLQRGGKISLFTSVQLLSELTDVLARPKLQKKIAASLLSVDQLVDLYTAVVTLVRPSLVSGVAADPDDDIVIGTALAARADSIVTGDRALLSVVEFERVRIISVAEALSQAAKTS